MNEERHIDSVFSISEQAFFSIVTSALEAYKLKHVLTNGDPAADLETFGHPYSHENDEVKIELELERGHYYRFSDTDFRA